MRRPALAIAIVLPVIFANPAQATCDLYNYDRTPPPHIKGSVDDQYAHFDWASDADLDPPNGSVIWNYIKNLDAGAPLVVNWPKGLIQISTIRPLPPAPDGIACRKVPARCATQQDAPILYSASNQHEDAAAYWSIQVTPESPCPTTAQAKGEESSSRPLSSNIKSTYLDDDHKAVDLRLVTFATVKDKREVDLQFEYRPSSLVVGFSTLAQRLNAEQISAISRRLKEKGIGFDQAKVANFTGINFGERKVLSFDAEWRGLDEQQFFFVWGKEGKVDLTFKHQPHHRKRWSQLLS